jgi:hypothetical protein
MNTKLIAAMGIVLGLAACASMPETNASLETARAAVQSAEIDPNVNRYAALDLAAARGDLTVAEDAAAHHNLPQIEQSSYLATQKAHLAQVHAATKANDARVAAGQVERDQIMLAARTREVQNARQSAENSQEWPPSHWRSAIKLPHSAIKLPHSAIKPRKRLPAYKRNWKR